MGQNSAIIEAAYAAANRRDLEALLTLIAAEFTIWQTDQLPWGGHYEGHEGFFSFFGKLAANVTSSVTNDELFEAGDRVVAIGRTKGHVNANGAEFDVRFVHVWMVKDGKIIGFNAYIDTPEMLKALAG